ncbi:hypothetical protein [Citrobacter portucalensis]|uniref:tail fiber/spike domain-containing protein n=1 Tax=Citrobacter portucalensis TaxID=1639133 RepID=UPI001CD1F4CA|nr:hypothetical protein [Citrobacter portucalensis]
MATQPTNLPVPSEKPQDLKFNAGKIDEFVTSMSQQYIDRFGGAHYTIEGLRWMAQQAIAAFGYITMDSFQDGATLTLPNQVLRDTTTGEYYRWDGEFPKDVPAGSTPDSSGGVGVGAWLSVGDAVLRDQISDQDGATKYPELQIARWRDIGDIRGWGAVEGEDATDAINAAIRDRAANGWGTSSDVIINGNYKINGQVILTTDVRLIGNWATISSSSDDWIFISGYKNSDGDIVNNFDGLTDEQVISEARLKGTQIKGITFVGVSKVFKLRCFNERCSLEDLLFENCGIAWDCTQPFYSSYKSIYIRSTKTGYEDWYAYQFRRATNLVYLEKVSISQRVYGELIDDDQITPTTPNPYYASVSHKQCSYEYVDYPVTLAIDGFNYSSEDYYAESVSNYMFLVTGGNHKDLYIGKPSWTYGVELMGAFKNLSGRSLIYQSSQNDYVPPKRGEILFENSTATVVLQSNMLQHKTIDQLDSGISYDTSSNILYSLMSYLSNGVAIDDTRLDGTSIPIKISGNIKSVNGVVIGTTGRSYQPSSDTLTFSTDIIFSYNNVISITLSWYQTSNPSNSYSSTAIWMNGYVIQASGQNASANKDGDLTAIIITNPSGNTSNQWLIDGDITVSGAIRIM